MKSNYTAIKEIKNKFKYALKGIKTTIKEEKSFQIELGMAIIIVILGFLMKLTFANWIDIVIIIGIILCVELINTAIETTIDVIGFNYSFNSEKIKNISAGATLIVSFVSIIVGLIIFITHLIGLINGSISWWV